MGFGVLSQQNLRFGGTYDATISSVVTVSTYGVQSGISAGDEIPEPNDDLAGLYLICQEAGNAVSVPNVESVDHQIGDWIVCLGSSQGWIHIDNSESGGGGGGASVLNDLLDVSLDDGVVDNLKTITPRVALADDQLLKYNSSDGVWRNTSKINCGSF